MVATASGDELEESCVRNRTDCERGLIDRNKQLCGTDNVTYINKCFLEMEVCRGNQIAIKHMGRCRNKQPCFKDIKKLQREQKVRKTNESFIPTCLKDGRYAPVQCHKESRYCWCVTPRGRPIPNTSKLNQKPNCAKRFKTRRRASARKSDREFCGRSDKLKFNENLMNLFRAEYGKDISGDEDPAYINQKILNWKFESIDRNDDDYLQRPEYRILRRLKKLVKPKKCAKTFAKLCDMDHDLRISKEEWSACLGENNIPLKTGAVASLSGQLPGFEHFKRKDEPEANDCFSDRQAVLSEQRSNNLYVPECTQDGRYNRIQCYKSTGYCWCVHEDDGKPIPGTSVKDQSPKCDSIPVPIRPMKGCPGEKKEIFLNDLMDFLVSKMLMKNGTRLPIEKIALMSFSSLDSNNNKYLERKEWKTFRALVSGNKNLRRCGKRLPRFCDVNNDRRISITEWTNCLDYKRTSGREVVPINVTTALSPLRRRGPNPLESFLKDDD